MPVTVKDWALIILLIVIVILSIFLSVATAPTNGCVRNSAWTEYIYLISEYRKKPNDMLLDKIRTVAPKFTSSNYERYIDVTKPNNKNDKFSNLMSAIDRGDILGEIAAREELIVNASL